MSRYRYPQHKPVEVTEMVKDLSDRQRDLFWSLRNTWWWEKRKVRYPFRNGTRQDDLALKEIVLRGWP